MRDAEIRALFVLLPVLGLAVACMEQPPRTAPGFEQEKLNRIRVAMGIDEVREILGSPLELPGKESANPPSALWYAEPGATWVLGEYRYNVHGFECILWFREGRLQGARVVNMNGYETCECYAQKCDAEWATPCLQTQRSGHAG